MGAVLPQANTPAQTRGLSLELRTALARNAIVTALLVNINGTRYTDASFDITSSLEGSSNTYAAQGLFIGVSEASENSDLTISGVSITLSALAPSVITTFATSSIINQTVQIFRVFFNQETKELIGDSTGDTGFLIFEGRVGAYNITDAETTGTVTLTVESQFANFERLNGRRTNLSSWQRGYDNISTTNDYSMEFSHEQLNDLRWGRK